MDLLLLQGNIFCSRYNRDRLLTLVNGQEGLEILEGLNGWDDLIIPRIEIRGYNIYRA